MVDPNSELFRAKQQVIYYRAEIAQCKNKIRELERLVEKEVVRNKYLQAKIRELNGEKIAGYLEEIQSLRMRVMELEVEVEEERLVKKDLQVSSLHSSKDKKENSLDFYSLFNYSFFLSPSDSSIIDIFGDFIVMNTGEIKMTDVLVCLKVTPIQNVTLSGKISNPKLIQQNNAKQADIDWIYATEDWREMIKNKGEYWIKSIKKSELRSYEKLVFSGFGVTVNNMEGGGKIKVEGTVFSKGIIKGIESKNKILIHL
ncbi:hypothetical protein LG307_07155 [Sutcliffiella horikoshii]|uniref:hypothetical protein n=1 Tax=Sutcliffiella horikoshii TaxID=79883 RepID=UPI00384EA905